MPERLRFERELEDLGLHETRDFDLAQDRAVWRQSGKKLQVDFYDRSNAHLQYLGRLIVQSTSNQFEIRLINRSDLADIYTANRLQASDPKDFAFSPATAAPEDKLFPDKVGSQGAFNRTKIEEESRKPGRPLQIWDDEKQRKRLSRLFEKAKTTGKEQGFYIVLKIYDRYERRAALWFLKAEPKTSSAVHFETNLGGTGPVGNKIRSVPNDKDKQVIGLLHTHFLKTEPAVAQSTTTGTTSSPGGRVVTRLVHGVSADDITSAQDNEFVVYALEADQIHKAMPSGRAINGTRWPSFNVLTDALESFAGKTT